MKSSKFSIGSVASLAKTLSVSEELLLDIAKNPKRHYRFSELEKKTGGVRMISDPSKELKTIQRRINSRLFSKIKFPDYLYGSVRDESNPRDFLRNAEFHQEAKEVISFDILSFFPSVRGGDIKAIYKYLMELPDTVANILLALTTLDSALPQGAPTSPYLANLLFFREEHKAVSQLKAKGFKYSRLVDDITISKEKIFTPLEKTFVYKTIFQMLKSRHLSINQKKYHISNTETHGKKTVITGLEIENGQVKLPKAKIKRIGGLVYSLQEQAAASGTTSNEYHNIYEHTSGLVSLYSRIDEKKSKSYRSTLRGVRPTFEATRIKKIRHLCNKFINFAHTHPDAREREGYTRKYHRLFHKLSIVRRTNRKTAKELELKLGAVKPKYSTRYFYA